MDRNTAEQVEVLMQGTAYGDPGLASAMAVELGGRLESRGEGGAAAPRLLRLRPPHRGPPPRAHRAAREAAPVPGSRPRGDGRGGNLHLARGRPFGQARRQGADAPRGGAEERPHVRGAGVPDPGPRPHPGRVQRRVAVPDRPGGVRRPRLPVHGPAAGRQGQLQGPVGAGRAGPAAGNLLPDPPGPGRLRAAGRRAGRRLGPALQHRHRLAPADGSVGPGSQRGGHRRAAARAPTGRRR